MFGNSHTGKISTNKGITFFVCLLAALSGLLFGLDIGVIAGALPFITNDFEVSNKQQEWIVSSMMFGASIGAIISGIISMKIGRKKSLSIGAIVFFIGSFWSACVTNPEMLIAARILLGIAVGISSYTAPLYLSEIAPEKIRGSMISLYQLMITMGILSAYFSDAAFSYTGNWRYMLGIITIPAFLLFFGVLFLPNSPRWLAAIGKFSEAKKVLMRLRNNKEQAEKEFHSIQESLKVKQSGWHLFKQNYNFRRAVYLGILLQIMQQFTGMNVIMYYAPRIFDMAGFNNTMQQMWGTVIIGIVNVLATFIAIFLVDKWGRKPTLTLGFLVMATSMGIIGNMLYNGIQSTEEKYLAIDMLLIFIVGFAMSAGPLVWVLCAEIQPLRGRDFGITVSTTTNWLANMIVGATFLTMIKILGSANTFWIYSGLNVLFIFLTQLLVPETKSVSLERIENNLLSGKKLRDIGTSK